jgi:hypothetical protein
MTHRLKKMSAATALALVLGSGGGGAVAGPVQWDHAKHDSDTLSVIDVVDVDTGFEAIETWVLSKIGAADLRNPQAWITALAEERRARDDHRPGRDKPNKVPEPDSLVLAGLGLLGIAFVHRRRRTTPSA